MIIVKARETRMDPIENIPEKEISPPALAELLFMLERIWVLELSNIGDGSYINDHKFISPKSWLQQKSQGWARVSKVLKFFAKFQSKS